MLNDNRERLVARIRKLRNLSQSPERHEAARAAEEAVRLMAEHGISEEDVSDDIDVVVETESDCYRMDIAHGVALVLGCKAFVNGSQIKFHGYRERVEGARLVYQSLIQEGRSKGELPAEVHIRLCHSTASGYVDINLAQKAWSCCYWPGFVASIVQRLWKIQAGEEEAKKYSSPTVAEAASVLNQTMGEMPREVMQQGLHEWFKQQGIARGRKIGDTAEIVVPQARTALGALT